MFYQEIFNLDPIPLPTFSNVTCPIAYKAYAACIVVSYPDGDSRDLMLLRKSKSAEIVLNGFLRDEPRVKAVVILADEDNENYHSVRSYRIFSL